ncbi:MAG: peptidylprolyl isomerase [Candidatus Delongbacteria bacterium]|nr:peptidylprolyl isomerase [Candidatus Delongbacteria bacterium]
MLLLLLTIIALASATVLDRVLAVVGDEIILQSEVDQAVSRLSIYNKNDPDSLKKLVIEDLIASKVMYSLAVRDTNIVVAEDEIEETLNQKINAIISQVGGEKILEEKYKTSVNKLKMDFRPDVKRSIFIDKLKMMQLTDIDVSRSEVESFFDSNKDKMGEIEASLDLAQLVISFNKLESNDDAVIAKLNEIKERIKNGEIEFYEAAKQFSEDTGSKDSGGEIGTTNRGDLVGEYEQVAYKLNIGDVSDPVKTEFGYHIIKLLDIAGEKIKTAHILMKPKPLELGLEKSIKFAQTVADSMHNGFLSFEESVKKYSDDEQTKFKNGSIGNIKESDLDPEALKMFIGLKAGDVTEPIEREDGVYLYKILRRTESHKVDLSTDYSILKEMTLAEKKEKYLKEWLEEQKSNVYIEIK